MIALTYDYDRCRYRYRYKHGFGSVCLFFIFTHYFMSVFHLQILVTVVGNSVTYNQTLVTVAGKLHEIYWCWCWCRYRYRYRCRYRYRYRHTGLAQSSLTMYRHSDTVLFYNSPHLFFSLVKYIVTNLFYLQLFMGFYLFSFLVIRLDSASRVQQQ
jgi:hypothetical protein